MDPHGFLVEKYSPKGYYIFLQFLSTSSFSHLLNCLLKLSDLLLFNSLNRNLSSDLPQFEGITFPPSQHYLFARFFPRIRE